MGSVRAELFPSTSRSLHFSPLIPPGPGKNKGKYMRIPFKMLTLLLVCFLSCGFTHKAKNDEYSSKHHISAQNHAEKNQHSLVQRAWGCGHSYVFVANPLPDLTVPASYDGRTNLWESTFPVRRGNSPSWDTASWMSAKCAQATSSPSRRSGGGYHTGIYIGDGRFIHAPHQFPRPR